MPQNKKRKQHKRSSKKLFFDRPYGVKLEELLDFYLKVIGDVDAEIDMKIDKVSITLTADRSNNERIAHQLQELQGQLLKATNPDGNGNYQYEQDLFHLIFSNPIQTKFLVDILKVFDYSSELTENKSIITTAPLFEIQRLQKLGYSSTQQVSSDQNKDIQRFAILLSLRSGKSFEEVLQLGIANGLLIEKDGKLHFSDTRENIQNELLEIVEDLSIGSDIAHEIVSSDTAEKEFGGFGFDGGKIVFINSNNDRKRSTFEDQEKQKVSKDTD